MNKEQLHQNLSSLERKIGLLLNEHKLLREELEGVKNENNQLKATIKAKDEQVSNFQNSMKISKIANIADTEGDPSELRKKIDEYIKEIDLCIAHLSK